MGSKYKKGLLKTCHLVGSYKTGTHKKAENNHLLSYMLCCGYSQLRHVIFVGTQENGILGLHCFPMYQLFTDSPPRNG